MWAAVLVTACGGSEPETEASRIEARLARNSVHVHLALRDGLEGSDGAELARQVREAASSRQAADRLAQRLHERREAGSEWLSDGRAPREAITRHLTPDAALDPADDHAAFFLALLLEDALDDTRIPKQVLVYEATRLQLDEVDDPVLQVVARAGRALTLARAGYCESARREAAAVLESTPTRAHAEASTGRWLSGAEVDIATVHADLGRALTVAAGATRACCAIRDEDMPAAASSVDDWVRDAEQLGVDPSRLAILRSWSALVGGDSDTAREQLGTVDQTTLDPEEVPRYRMVRDALASRGEQSLDDAAAQLVDRRWLSSLALRGVHHAFSEDGLLEAIRASETGRELTQFAAGHAAMTDAARDRYPLFNQIHQADRGPMERLGELFR